jgi:hypothetical protein
MPGTFCIGNGSHGGCVTESAFLLCSIRERIVMPGTFCTENMPVGFTVHTP